MKPIPIVSVCIPAYNSAKYLGEAIQSVLNQTFADFELIIADNASTDNTEEIVKSFDDQRIKYYKNSTNVSMYANFNKCIDYAKGEYIKFLCADDYFKPKLLEEMVKLLNRNPNVGIMSAATQYIFARGFLNHSFFTSDIIASGKGIAKLAVMHGNIVGEPTRVIIRKSCLSNVGFFRTDFETGWCSDLELWLRILAKYNFAYIVNPMCIIRRHDKSATSFVLQSCLDISEEFRLLHMIMADKNRYCEISFFNKQKSIWRVSRRGLYRFFTLILQGNYLTSSKLIKLILKNNNILAFFPLAIVFILKAILFRLWTKKW